MEMARPCIERGFLAIEGNHLHLTETGIFISDDIISDLMDVEH
jgi:coproporphyrinogen III oxidase-like Fe-S oxidoreductase